MNICHIYEYRDFIDTVVLKRWHKSVYSRLIEVIRQYPSSLQVNATGGTGIQHLIPTYTRVVPKVLSLVEKEEHS